MSIIRKTILNDMEYLRQISTPVDLNDSNLTEELKLLKQFCLENTCFALAAVQIGIPKRIIYLKNTTEDVLLYEDITYDESKILINPIIVSRKGHTKYWENCVSCLDNMGLVDRPYEIIADYFDENGIKHNQTFIKFKSNILSHEMDHLDGVLHMDIAERVLQMPYEERMAYRKEHPLEVISEDCDYEEIYRKIKKFRS